MKTRELFHALIRPFESADLEWRAMFTKAPDQSRGQDKPLILVAPYVNRPALINRLNQVCGLDGWQTDTRITAGAVRPPTGSSKADRSHIVMGHVAVGVGIRVGTDPAEWIWRWDGAGMLEPEPPYFRGSDAGKGDYSNAFKRACEQFGIGLYLRELKAMRAILDPEGRYKSTVQGVGVQRWNPPGIQGTPSYPGTIPGFDRSEGAPDDGPDQDEGTDTSTSTEAPPQASPPKPMTAEEEAAALNASKSVVRAYMRQHGYKPYHLDALVQCHPKLKDRYIDGSALGELGTLEDWLHVEELTRRQRGRWDEAPRTLAEEFPTGPERLQLLDELLDRIEVHGKELVEINTQRQIGWNDSIEWWIDNLEQRT